jgi:signal peptidase I
MSSSDNPNADPRVPDDFEAYDSFDSATRYGSRDEDTLQPETDSPPEGSSATSERARRRGGIAREIIETALIAILIFVAVRSLVLNFRVDGSSMLPNLVDGEMLLVNRNAYDSFDLYTFVDWIPGVEHANAKEVTPFDGPDRGDIVVFDPPVASSKPYIKRVIGLPGETVEIRDGSVYIDGVRLEEDYVEDGITDCGQRECNIITVPEGHIFVMGDNRRNSSDSRFFGPVEIDAVQGKAWVVYWPISEVGRIDVADYPDE